MKKTLFFGIALLAFASCGNNDSPEPDKGEIRMSAQVETKSGTYAPINSNFSTDFPIGIYANNGAWLAGTSANWINNDASTVLGAAGHAITFGSGPYYFPTNGSTLNFYAFAPRATESTVAAAGVSPQVTHTITGQEDVMWATSTGYKQGSNAAVQPVLNFQHKLTQLQFTFKSGPNYPASGNKVISLKVKAQPTTAVMVVETGTCTFSGSADMEILSAANQTAGIGITTAGTNAFSPIMTNISSNYLLDIVVKPATGSNVSYSVTIPSFTSVIGSAHMLTITFNAATASCSASVADWVLGTGGSGTAQ